MPQEGGFTVVAPLLTFFNRLPEIRDIHGGLHIVCVRAYRQKFLALTVPTTDICLWPKDVVLPPREWAERFYNVRRYDVQAYGGHFPVWEQAEIYAAAIQTFRQILAQ